jgi:hypothetical protein
VGATAASIALPEGWVDRTVLTYVGPDRGAGSPSLVVTSDRLGPDVAVGRYAAMQDAAMRAGMEGIELVEERETTVAGHAAVRLSYSWRWEQRGMRQRVWCLVEDEVGYTITATAAEDEFDAHRAAFAAAVASFQIG